MSKINKNTKEVFKRKLLDWHKNINKREFPWVHEKDPYKIWVSEIMLQQTRAEQALPFYLKFIKKFPDITTLAKTSLEEVLLYWEGLGYYSRCRNLHSSARFLYENYQGEFPKTYAEIIQLKGIGSYTAAAIASFAYKLPYAVLDTNVYRVLSRYFAIDLDIQKASSKKYFLELANAIIPQNKPDAFNQAIMDFGATVCAPKLPACGACIMKTSCSAYHKEKVTDYPINSKKTKIKKRYFNYFLLQFEDLVYIEQRNESDIWKALFQFYLIEKKIKNSEEKVKDLNYLPKEWEIENIISAGEYKQKLSHQEIFTRFYIVHLQQIPQDLKSALWVPINNLESYAFPKTLTQFIKNTLPVFE